MAESGAGGSADPPAASASTTPPGVEHAPSFRAGALWLSLLALATKAYFMPAPAANEISRFSLVRALVERGTVDIDPWAALTPDTARRGAHVYSDKAPGAALLATPAYALYLAGVARTGAPAPAAVKASTLEEAVSRRFREDAGDPWLFNAAFRRGIYVCNLATNALAGALLVGLFLMILGRWGVPPRVALVHAATLGGGTLIFAYSTTFFGHVLAATGLFLAFSWLDRDDEPVAKAGPRSLRLAFGAGLATGAAILCELPCLLALPIFVAMLATGPQAALRKQRLGAFVIGLVPPLLMLGVYQTVAFGGPLATGYAHVSHPIFAAGMQKGLLGVSWPRPSVLLEILIGRSRGLLILSPVLAFALVGLWRGIRRPPTRRRALIATAMVVAFALLNAGYYMWWGGAAIGPRHMIPGLPFLALGLAWLPGLGGLPRLVWGVLAGLSIVNQLGAVAVSPLAPPAVDLLFGYVYGHIFRGEIAIASGSANLGMVLGLPGLLSLVPLLGLWLLGALNVLGALPSGTGDARASSA